MRNVDVENPAEAGSHERDGVERRLNLQFKGDRTYLQGPDMFNETLRWLTSTAGAELKDIDFSFHRLAHRQLTATADTPRSDSNPVAVCAFTVNDVRRKVYLVETDQPVTGRYPYPEDEIVRPLDIDHDRHSGVLRGPTPYSEIEVWVAITKALHMSTLPDRKGKWLFVRGRLPKFVHKAHAPERTLTIAAGLGGRLTRTEVLLDGVTAGEIYFSLA